MGYTRKEWGIELNPFRVAESALKKIGNTVEAIIEKPIPALLQIGGAAIGIPPYVTAAAITAARGGDIEDIAKSAAVSYITSDFLQNTQIGADIRNYTSNLVAGDVTDFMIENFDISMDQAVTVSKMTTAALNGALVGGIGATILGKDISDAVTSGFTSGLVYSGVDSYFDDLNKDPNWGYGPKALNLMKGATSTALNTLISGKGDPGEAVSNYIAYASLKLGASEAKTALQRAYEDFTGKTDEARNAQQAYISVKAEYDAAVRRHDEMANRIRDDSREYETLYDSELKPLREEMDRYKSEYELQKIIYEKEKQFFEESKNAYENYDDWVRQQGFAAGINPDTNTSEYQKVQGAAIDVLSGAPMTTFVYENGQYKAKIVPDGSVLDENGNPTVKIEVAPTKDEIAQRAKDAAQAANTSAALAQEAAEKFQTISESDSTKSVVDRLAAMKREIELNSESLKTLRNDLEKPANGNLAERLKVAAERYDKKYNLYKTSEEAKNKASENYNRIIADVATRDAMIDSINLGAITVTGRTEDGGFQLDNGMVVKDGKFFQDNKPLFTNAAGLQQNALELLDSDGQVYRYGMDAGRQMSSTDIQNVFRRDYQIEISDTEARRFIGGQYGTVDQQKLDDFAKARAQQTYRMIAGQEPTQEQLQKFIETPNAQQAATNAAIRIVETNPSVVDNERALALREKAGREVIKSYYDQGLSSEEVDARIASGQALKDMQARLDPEKEAARQQIEKVKQVEAQFGINSPEYRQAYQGALEQMAAVGGYDVVKNADGSYSHTSLGRINQDTLLPDTDRSFVDPVTGVKRIDPVEAKATGDFDSRDVSIVKGRLSDMLGDPKTNPADLSRKEMANFVDNFAKATPEQRAELLRGSDSSTYQVINDMFQSYSGVAEKMSGQTYEKPESIGSLKESDLTNYQQILKTGVRGAAADIVGLGTRAGQTLGELLGYDTPTLDKLQELMTKEKNTNMDKLVGNEKAVASGLASGLISAGAFATGGALSSVLLMGGVAANNSWIEGANAVIDKDNNTYRNEEEAKKNGVFEYRKLTPEENGLRTAMMTAAEMVGEALGAKAMGAIMKGVPISGSPSEIIDATRRVAVGMLGEQGAEQLTTAMQMAADKWTSVGLGKNATFEDYVNAMKDTAIATAVAVGTANSSATLSQSLRDASRTPNIFSMDTRETEVVPTLPSLVKAFEEVGISEKQTNDIIKSIQESVKAGGVGLPEARNNTVETLVENGVPQVRAQSLANEMLDRALTEGITADLKSQGLSETEIAELIKPVKDITTDFKKGVDSPEQKGFDELYRVLTDPKLTGQLYPEKKPEQPTVPADSTVTPPVPPQPQEPVQPPDTPPTGTVTPPVTPPATPVTPQQPSNQELQQLKSEVTSQVGGVETRLSAAIDAARQAGLEGDAALQAGLDKVAADIGSTKDELLTQVGKTEQQLRSELASQLGGVQQQIGQVQSDLTKAIADAKAAGATDVQAVREALATVSSSLGTTEAALLSQLDKSEADLRAELRAGQQSTQQQIESLGSTFMQQYDALNATQKAQFDAMVEQGANLRTAMDLVRSEAQAAQEQTRQQIAQLDVSTQAKFEQMSEAQRQQALQLAQTSGDLTTAINNVATSTATQITGVETRLRDAMAANEAAGLSRDAAATKAIQDVATSVGTTKDALLAQLGMSEQTLRSELAFGLQQTQQQLSQQMQAQYDSLSAAQKAEVDARVQQGQNLTAAIQSVGAQTTQQLAQTETALRQAIGQLGTDVQNQFNSMDAAQKAEVQARVQQGQDLQAAIANVGAQTEAKLAQTQAGLEAAIGRLGSDVQSQFSQMDAAQKAEVAARVQQGQDLQSAIANVGTAAAQQIAQSEAGLREAIGQLGTNVQGQFDAMTAAQKAEVAARVQQGQDLQTAISNVGTQTQQQIAASETAMREALGQLGTDVRSQFDQMSQAQKAEVTARMQQGQDLQTAIQNVGQQAAQQLTEAQTALRGQITTLGEDLQRQYNDMSAAQQAEVAARVEQGQKLDTAIASVGTQLGQVEEKLTTSVEDIRKKIEAENARKAAADRAAAGKAQQEKLLQQATTLTGAPAGAAASEDVGLSKTQVPKTLSTGEAQQTEFKGPLEEFLKKVETTSYTQPAGQPMQQPQPTQVAQQQTAPQQGPNYYSYGVANEIDQILNPMANLTPSLFAKTGGLATPMFAQGGLNVVHHAGKHRLDFRQGAAVSGPGDGQSDDIPAMLADGEFVFPADVVAALGNGSTKAGSDKLYDMMHSIRSYHRSAKPEDLPPPAKKSPLDYLKKARR